MIGWLTAGRSWRWINVLLLVWALWALAGIYLPDWWMALRERFSIEYEGHVLWACQQLAGGGNVYSLDSLISSPWAVVIYNPLYIMCGAILLKLSGLAYWPLRLISMLSAVACQIALFRILRHGGCNRTVSAIGCLFFAGFLPVAYWSCLARVDLFGLALAAFAVERFVAGLRSGKPSQSGWEQYRSCLVLLVLAFFAKQQYFVFAIGLAAYLAFVGERKLAGRFVLIWFVSISGGAILLQLITQGYFAHLGFASALPWEWDTLTYHLQLIARDPKTPFGLFLLLANLMAHKRLPAQHYVPISIMCVSLPLLLWTMGLRGAYHNHLLSTIFVFSWWSALALSGLRPWVAAVTLTVMLYGMSEPQRMTEKLANIVKHDRYNRAWVKILRAPEFRRRMVLCEDPSLAMFAGDSPAIIDATTFMNVWTSRQQPMDALLEGIKSRSYSAIIMNHYDSRQYAGVIWPAKVVTLVRRTYKLCGWVKGNGNDQDLYIRTDRMITGPQAGSPAK